MKRFKFLLLSLVIPLFAFTAMHKYYISVTQIEYIEEKKSVQITSRIFIDDFESLLRERYDDSLTLAENTESETINIYIERYLKEKIKIRINESDVNFMFIGKEYDGDIMRCYLEVVDVETINSIEIKNQVLFDLYTEQQNLIKLKVNSKQKSYILSPQNDTALLSFN
ncbi:MAG: DUF6702 family protein [Algibacter sp.]